ncbi:magnesium/cobalt transporter CorA [Crocinitomix catalasitica]|uniref:magnesium/cobalt transporter CorA n=1 Tax=Crocinitomix catalasitica TaxID=184607 RepID=UPI000686C6A4|nr:magnesium/cobalt transporter CorA [Crocinitomix catalasitica]
MRKKLKIPAIKRTRFLKRQDATAGMRPGQLIFVGDQKQEAIEMEVIAYDKESYIVEKINSITEIDWIREKYKNVWLNINGLHDINIIEEIGRFFKIHPLVLEDVLNTGHQPKIDEGETELFFILKMLKLEDNLLDAEQFSMVLTENILITFQEKNGDVFKPVRERIYADQGRIRKSGLDYLAFSLIDRLTENYISIMEYFGSKVEDLEDKILLQPTKDLLTEINRNKVELNFFRKIIRPTRESVYLFVKSDNKFVQPSTKRYMNDLMDSTNRAFDLVETYKDMLSEQLTVYSTNVNNRLNDVMKVLTIFSAVFIPLTFIAGIYGTNFKYVPELDYKYSYYIMWGVMIIIAAGMIFYFKKKKWF